MRKFLKSHFKSSFNYKNIKELVNTLIFAFIFAFLFQTFLYQPFKIPSGSMKPGLEIGDYLFVNKFAYGYNNSSFSFMLNRFDLFEGTYKINPPKRGDVVVFLLPKDRSMHYIKRLIGLPGDKIQVKDGILYINEEPVKREYKGKKIVMEQNKVKYNMDIFEEILPNGVKYEIYMYNLRQSSHNTFDHNNTPVYIVPKDHYFFMGDNRDNSIDSRFNKVSYVPKDNLLGKALFLFWTSDFSIWDFITKLQTNRAFKTIN